MSNSLRGAQSRRTVLISALCGALPDLDGIGFHLGVPYLHEWGHRGMTHSVCFALVSGLLLGLLFSEGRRIGARLGWGLFFGLLIVTHPLLDMLTTGGHGIALWAPWDSERIFFPSEYRVVRVSPMSLSTRLWSTLASEFYWIWIPTLSLGLCAWVGRRLFKREKA